MYPLKRAKEPADFARKVRQRGMAFLRGKGIAPASAAPEHFNFKPYWRSCKKELLRSYGEYCAFTGAYIHEASTGVSHVDHIEPKSKAPAYLAYEWKNYCVACHKINCKKGEQQGLLNPFDVRAGMFELVLATGHIYACPGNPKFAIADRTIQKNGLDLDSQHWQKHRQSCFVEYKKNRASGMSQSRAEELLKRENRFVWSEAKRQGRLS